MPNPPSKGALAGAPQPKPAVLRVTRSSTSAAASSKNLSDPNEAALSGKQHTQAIEPVADVAHTPAHKEFSTSIATLQPIVEALNKILNGNGSTIVIIKGVFRYIKELETAEGCNKDKLEIQTEVSSFCNTFKTQLSQIQDKLNHRLNGITETMNVTLKTTEKTLKVTEEIKGKTSDIMSDVGKVTSITGKIVDTTQSYRNALITRQLTPPSNKSSIDPKILSNMERKDRQILVDIYNEEGTCTMDKSLSELMDKANEVLDKMSDANKPEKTKVISIHKTKRNAILLTLNSKEAATWVREVGNEETFANAFAKGAHLREREYNLIVPRVPLTFDPKNITDLREIEESNRLATHVIRKAKWIKPVERRRPGQTHAYTVLTVTSVDTANKLIRDGIGICNSYSRLTKQKQEPIQCMKCRRWGHFTDKCPEGEDTCGTCGDKHRTSACKASNKLYCVSCAVTSHASWDRACLEFLKRCKNINERNPVNSMPFFPAEQDWTLVVRPSRIPLEERFPATFAVNFLPTHGRRPQRGPPKASRSRGELSNPNNIPLPETSRFTAGSSGADTGYMQPQWQPFPTEDGTGSWENDNAEGDVTKHNT